MEPEIVVDSAYRRTILTVECISSEDASTDEAVRLRDELLPPEIERDDCFFILTLPSVMHLWNPGHARGAPPDYSAPLHEEVRQYLPSGRPLLRDRLRFAIVLWLDGVSFGRPAGSSEAEQMLVASGLYERLKGGHVRTDFDR